MMRNTSATIVRRRWPWLALAFLLWAPANVAQSNQSPVEYLEGAITWQQSSGEARALAYQAFTVARMMLDRDLRINRRNRMRRAVVVDVDETILDNSRYLVQGILDRTPHSSQRFTDWVNRAEASAVPGAVEFLRYADSRGVRVFYITNRKQVEKEGTAANLRKMGFPRVNDETVLVKPDQGESSKEPRRLAVRGKYRIVLLMGDNLNDFAEIFEKSKTVDSRLQATDLNKSEFGRRFIVLPNPIYGDWESAIYDYNFKRSDEEKSALRKKVLRGY